MPLEVQNQRLLGRALDTVIELDLGISNYVLRSDPEKALVRAGRLLSIPVPPVWTDQTLRLFVVRLEAEEE